jgi:hypothetical protein
MTEEAQNKIEFILWHVEYSDSLLYLFLLLSLIRGRLVDRYAVFVPHYVIAVTKASLNI